MDLATLYQVYNGCDCAPRRGGLNDSIRRGAVTSHLPRVKVHRGTRCRSHSDCSKVNVGSACLTSTPTRFCSDGEHPFSIAGARRMLPQPQGLRPGRTLRSPTLAGEPGIKPPLDAQRRIAHTASL